MIKRLDIDISTRIAAGEVIERPSSVAKELIENCIDASAENITLYIEQGGKTSFVIEDDGIGISQGELPLALERYATSKISTIDDLERISTLGYRGEALASVSAVSRMEIRSRQKDSDTGGIIRSEGGTVTLHTDMPCQYGTRIQVEDLFFNLPARRKFLKTASAELRRIIQVVNDYAIIHPEITFRIFSDGKKILEHLHTVSIDNMITRRWGEDTQRYFSESEVSSTKLKIWWNPIADSRRVIITLFVNGRRIQDTTVRAAVCSGDSVAYGEWLLILNMPPEQLDVNIHPAKEEVRFRRSQEIFKLVHDNVQNIFSGRYSMNNNAVSSSCDNAQLTIKCSASHQTFDRTNPIFSSQPWEALEKNAENRAASAEHIIFIPGESSERPDIQRIKNYIGQTEKGFLLFDFTYGLAIMDPHAAHERILFEEITESFKDSVVTQKLAVPIEVPAAILPELKLIEKEIFSLGFLIEGDYLTGTPLLRGKGRLSPLEMLRSAMRGIEVENDPVKRDREVWWRLAKLACRDAVKLGHIFEREEATELLYKLEMCKTPYTCPHGRPTVFIIDHKKLEEWFER